MRQRTGSGSFFLYVVLFASLLGLGDSLAILQKDLAAPTNPNVFQTCNLSSILSCGEVAKSAYAHFLGLPVSLWGVMFYEAATLIVLALLLGLPQRRWLTWLLSLAVAFGFLFSLRLLYYSWFGIGYLCPYCLVSDGSSLLVTLAWFMYLSFLRNNAKRMTPLP